MDLAKSRFEQFGFQETALREIFKDARISARTLYECFTSKEELFDAIFIREMLKSKENAWNSLEKAKIDDPDEVTRLAIKTTVRYPRKDLFIHRVLSFENDLYPPFQK